MGGEFLRDLQDLIKSGKLKFIGEGTLNRDSGAGLIFRGQGVTLVLKPGGEFWTLLKSGEGMDAEIVITKAAQ